MDSKNYPEEKIVNDQPIIAYSDQTSRGIFILPKDADPASPKSRKRRAARGFLTLITIWLLYSTASAYISRSFGENCHVSTERVAASVVEWPIPPDVKVDRCADWVEDSAIVTDALRERYSSSTTFELPISSDKLFLISRGSSAGSVDVVQSDETGDVAKVHIVAKYRYPSALDRARVCAIHRDGGEIGVGIFSPEWSGRVYVHFEITVHLPAASTKSPLRIKNFETNLPLFTHGFGDIANTVNFDELSVKSSMMAISVRSLSATKARLETSNAVIEGNFNTSSALDLSTSNAAINVNVGLFNGKDAEATSLTMATSNARMIAGMSLVSGGGTGGKFKVIGTTSLSALDLGFITAPVASSLVLDAQTSLAPATIKLHETFEGTFRLSTSLKRPTVKVNERVEDPAGKGRRRKVEIHSDGPSHTSGSISWSEEGDNLGSVNVGTSLSPVVLEF